MAVRFSGALASIAFLVIIEIETFIMMMKRDCKNLFLLMQRNPVY